VFPRIALFCLVAALAPAGVWAQEDDTEDDPLAGLNDWLSIPDFTAEIAVGTGVGPDGALLGDASRFAKHVGTVYCRIDAIGLTETQNLTVVWYRVGEDLARQQVQLTKAKPNAVVSLNIPATQAGSWRVEVSAADDQVLAVAPFVVGAPSIGGRPAPKPAPTHP